MFLILYRHVTGELIISSICVPRLTVTWASLTAKRKAKLESLVSIRHIRYQAYIHTYNRHYTLHSSFLTWSLITWHITIPPVALKTSRRPVSRRFVTLAHANNRHFSCPKADSNSLIEDSGYIFKAFDLCVSFLVRPCLYSRVEISVRSEPSMI